MSRRYHQSPGYLDRQPSWDVVEVEPTEIESRGPPPQVYYDPPRPSSPTGLLQYEGRPRYGSISSPKSVSPVRNSRDNTGRVRFETQSRRPRFMRSRSRDSEEWALNDQLRQSEKERGWDREIDDLRAEIRAKERVRRLNRDQDETSGLAPSQSGGLSRAQGYYPHRNFLSPDSVAGSTLGARRNSIAVQVQGEQSSDSNVGESDDEESDTESSSSFGFGIPGSQNHGPSQNGDHNHDPNTISPELQESVGNDGAGRQTD
ncbi:uncharacterized protein K441DRAFT_661223 [Cenococcum geophilum 1.58]|uniref:uncharacterized protein n=1 Tax=Cenococcum geophilum 1.58 TaxID=794803 RepID=UPI00358F4592|nr:hypothetical protein K441DRAFT_661223 [Cenococcum geophilum 1.58]